MSVDKPKTTDVAGTKKKHKGGATKMESLENRVAPILVSSAAAQVADMHEAQGRGFDRLDPMGSAQAGGNFGAGGFGGGGLTLNINNGNVIDAHSTSDSIAGAQTGGGAMNLGSGTQVNGNGNIVGDGANGNTGFQNSGTFAVNSGNDNSKTFSVSAGGDIVGHDKNTVGDVSLNVDQSKTQNIEFTDNSDNSVHDNNGQTAVAGKGGLAGNVGLGFGVDLGDKSGGAGAGRQLVGELPQDGSPQAPEAMSYRK